MQWNPYNLAWSMNILGAQGNKKYSKKTREYRMCAIYGISFANFICNLLRFESFAEQPGFER